MHALTYLFNSIQRTFSEEDWRVGHLPQAGCAEACWVVPGDHSLLQLPFQRCSLDPLSFRKLPVENSTPLLIQISGCGLRPFVSLSCIPLLSPDTEGHRRIPLPQLKMH